MKYSDLKKEIYGYYKHCGDINIDNIQEVNDHITDEHLSKSYFENTITEFYVTTSMCTYMIENDLYDEYFFDTFPELLEEFNNSSSIMNEIEDELKSDIDNVSDYLKKEKTKEEYYNKLSEVYEQDINIDDGEE